MSQIALDWIRFDSVFHPPNHLSKIRSPTYPNPSHLTSHSSFPSACRAHGRESYLGLENCHPIPRPNHRKVIAYLPSDRPLPPTQIFSFYAVPSPPSISPFLPFSFSPFLPSSLPKSTLAKKKKKKRKKKRAHRSTPLFEILQHLFWLTRRSPPSLIAILPLPAILSPAMIEEALNRALPI